MKKFLLILMTCVMAMSLFAQIPAGDAQPCPGMATMTDADGNVYNTVKIGTQCWTKENMRSTKAADGTPIPAGGSNSSSIDPYYYDNSSDSLPLEMRGYLYNWPAAMLVCPTGWHLPSDAEWRALTDYVSGQSDYVCGGIGIYNAKALASTEGWNTYSGTCAVGNDQSTNNASGFSAVPAGGCYGSSFNSAGSRAQFFSSTEDTSNCVWSFFLRYSEVTVYGLLTNNKDRGHSVRCLRDDGYGDAIPCPGTPTVTDYDGNTYNTVQIGNQCWMKENLRTMHKPDGTPIDAGANLGGNCWPVCDTSSTNSFFYNPSSDIPLAERGYLYNWPAAKVACPTGWHLPSALEWQTLAYYVKNQEGYLCDGNTDNIAKALSSTTWWNSYNDDSCYPGNQLAMNNATGFSAVPAGSRNASDYSSVVGQRQWTMFWTSTETSWYDGDGAFTYTLGYSSATMDRTYDERAMGLSVRCLRDESSVSTNDGQPCPGIPTISDIDGNTYNTVRIGNQCWMKENLRTTHYPDGTDIPYVSSSSNPTDYYDDNTSCPLPLVDRGYQYSWYAAMHGAASSDALPSGVQGICPTGWHLPSSAEWTALIDYMGTQPQYTCGGNPENIAKALASTSWWSTNISDDNLCVVGVDLTLNNASGFSAVPTDEERQYAGFWTSTISPIWGSGYALCTSLGWGDDYFGMGSSSITSGTAGVSSVRCLRNAPLGDAIPCPGVPTMTDADGNVYETVKIGTQCWTKTNMRVAPAGATGETSSDSSSNRVPHYYVHSSVDAAIYGYYYNWEAAKLACPSGWHLPSDEEWTQLTNYVSSQSGYTCGGNSSYIAKALASETEWRYDPDECDTCSVGYLSTNNASGFSAFPASLWSNGFIGLTRHDNAIFWSSTEAAEINRAWARALNYFQADVNRSQSPRYQGLSVRCLRDTGPAVITGSVLGVTSTSATCNGEVVDDGGFDVTARGVCWSTSHNPTIANSHTSNGTGVGEFASNLTNLTPGTTYYVRAYATNSEGTAYGEEVSFFTSCPPENQCELTFVLTDSYGDGWTGSAIQVTDAETGALLGYLANEDLDGYTSNTEETQTVTLAVCDGRTVNFEWVYGEWLYESSYTVYDAHGEIILSGTGGFEPISYTVNCAAPCPAITLPYTENFDSYTQSTATATGTEPDCWELVRTDAASMPDDKRPQLCYNSSFAHSGSYSLKMSNRCVYAMPELAEDVQVNKLRLDMFLRQANARYRLEVGIWDGQTFVPVATFDNGSTDVLAVSCDFSSYTGNGRRVAFRNTLGDGSNLAYSTNYLDDITLSLQLCEAITPPYTENFDSFTQSTATATGVEPNCWELVRTDASSMPDDKRPQLCYNSSFAHSGSYSLKMSNRCVYAMPELSEDVQVNKLRLDMFLRQANARYRLEVGIWDGQTFVPVATFNNSTTDVEFVTCDFSGYNGNGRRIAFRNTLGDGSNLAYSTNYLDDITLSLQLCEAITPPYTENFDSFTQSTTTATGVEPDCWELVRTDASSMPDDKRPQLCYNSSFAHSGSYSLKMSNRCVYAMPELAEDVQVNKLRLDMFLRQANARYRLEVGIWDGQTFVPVATFDNGSTDVLPVSCNFSSYTGNGRRIAFRNTLGDGSNLAYSTNYLDDITLSVNTGTDCEAITLPYSENFDSYTQSTTAATGVQPDCWELVRIDATSMPDDKLPQIYYNSSFAHSGDYSLKLYNRGVYAMPELVLEEGTSMSRVKLDMYLRQANAAYQLEVGVWDGQEFVPVKRINNSTTNVEFVTCDFSNYTGNGKRIAFRNVLGSGTYAYSVNYLDDITLTVVENCSVTLPYSEPFEDYTTSTTAATGVEPTCWELVRTDATSMPDDKRPQIYYNSSFASSGNYTLKMGNRCVYAMPELGPNVPIKRIALDMYLRQPNAAYRLEVGVWDEATNTFERVKLINNSTTAVEHVSCDFSGYTGNGRRVAFRNTLNNGKTWDYSYNYLDDITLTRIDNNKSADVTSSNAADPGMLGADRDMVDILVYPNPTRDYINVECTMNNVQCSGIEVIDVYGKVVRTVVGANNDSPTQINVSGLAAGMYFVRVTTEEGVVTKPFVKK